MSPVQRRPGVSFGRYCVRGTGVPVSVLYDRWRAGDRPWALARDYRLPRAAVLAAILWYRDRYGGGA